MLPCLLWTVTYCDRCECLSDSERRGTKQGPSQVDWCFERQESRGVGQRRRRDEHRRRKGTLRWRLKAVPFAFKRCRFFAALELSALLFSLAALRRNASLRRFKLAFPTNLASVRTLAYSSFRTLALRSQGNFWHSLAACAKDRGRDLKLGARAKQST